MQADKEVIELLKSIRRRWLSASVSEWNKAHRHYHECSESEAGGKCKGKQDTYEACAHDIENLLSRLEG